MDLELVREYCLSKKGTTEDYPFDEETPVYRVMGKMFCLGNLNPPVSINLKCDPEKAMELREEFDQVKPGYHMNKKHWNTVEFEGHATNDEIFSWIDHSYQLVADGLKKKEKEELNKL